MDRLPTKLVVAGRERQQVRWIRLPTRWQRPVLLLLMLKLLLELQKMLLLLRLQLQLLLVQLLQRLLVLLVQLRVLVLLVQQLQLLLLGRQQLLLQLLLKVVLVEWQLWILQLAVALLKQLTVQLLLIGRVHLGHRGGVRAVVLWVLQQGVASASLSCRHSAVHQGGGGRLHRWRRHGRDMGLISHVRAREEVLLLILNVQ